MWSSNLFWMSLEVWQGAPPSCIRMVSGRSMKLAWIQGRTWGFKTWTKYSLASILRLIGQKSRGIWRSFPVTNPKIMTRARHFEVWTNLMVLEAALALVLFMNLLVWLLMKYV